LTHKITIPCHTSKLKDVRDFVTEVIRLFYLSEKEQFLLVLAIDEICANRILHSNHNDTTRNLEVEIASQDGTVIFCIKDEGDFFDLNQNESTPVDRLVKDRRKGGLGVSLIKKIIDSVEVFKEGHYTIHRLIKKSSVSTSF
jgi:serine/threonine-protein kinase RsbW